MSTVIGKIDIAAFDGDGLEIIGTDGADILRGTSRDDLILGGAGNDIIRGRGGDDQIAGEEGNDLIFGGFGNDIIEGGSGDDLIFGQFGDDCIHGGSGNDLIRGGKGDDIIDGGEGSDLIFGGGGKDVFEFNIEDFELGIIDAIGDFHVGQDTIVINGLSDEDELTFDPITNTVSLNGNSIISLTLVDDFRPPQIEENEDGGFEII